MAASLEHVLAQIHRWTSPGLGDLADAVLLERYVQQRDGSAFAALVARHGAMVLHTCRRIVTHVQEIEDAFQATFLILGREAHTLRRPAALPGYLHSIARRVALKSRVKAAAHRGRTLLSDELLDPHADPLEQLSARELLTVLDDEVARLPLAQRTAVVSCCLEGHTQEEAARRLGWTAGSLKGHLERGRRRLQDRLRRRGIALSTALAIVVVSRGEGATALLLRNTVAAALGGGGSSVAALAHSVLQAMFLGKMAAGITVMLTVALTASAMVALILRGPLAPTPEDKPPAIPLAVKNAEPGKPIVRTDALGDPLPPRAVARLGSLRLYHGQSVQRVTLSPDGKWVVSRASDRNRLWDAATGRELPLRPELRDAAVFSTRDKLVAVQRADKNIHLWDLAAGKKIGRPLAVGPPFLDAFALSPDGHTLVLHRMEGANLSWVLRFCDSSTRKIGDAIHVLKKGGAIANEGYAFSTDGKTLVLLYQDMTIHVWDVGGRRELRASRPNPKFGPPGFLALSPDGRILATAPFAGKHIHLWDTHTLTELPPLLDQPNEVVQPITFSPDGKLLAATYPAPTVRLWDLTTRKQARSFRGKSYQVFHTAFSTDGKYLVAADGAEVTFWDRATGKFRHDFNFGHSYCVDSVAFAPDGKRLVSGAGYSDKIVRIWDPLSGKETAQLAGHKGGIQVVAYAPDGKWIASGSQDKTIRLWDAATGREVRRFEAKDSMVYALAFAPDGKTLASGGAGKAVHLWDVATGRELRGFPNPGSWTLRLAFSPDGTMLATRGFDEKNIRLWNVAKGQPLRQLAAPAAGCPSLAFSPDSTVLAAGADDAAVHFWNTVSGDKLRSCAVALQPLHFNRVLSIAYAPDGRSLAAGYDEGIVRLWELASGQERLRLEGHRAGIASLAFSPDGTLLASGGSDRIIMVWDVTGQRTTHFARKGRLRPEEGNALWNDLADADAGKAYRAMQSLRAAPEQAAALLKQRLHPAPVIDARRIDRLIADLDSDQFPIREKAEQELRKIGDNAEPGLRKCLRGKPSVEQALRVKQLLEALGTIPAPARLRALRAVEVLEGLGTAEARQLLKKLAGGDPQTRLTRAAKAALERLANGRR